MAGPDDLICVTGSVFLAGEMRSLLTAAAGVSRLMRINQPAHAGRSPNLS